VPKLNRNVAVAASVVLFHLAALWALQAGLWHRAVEVVVPVAILTEMVTPLLPPRADTPRPPQPAPKPPEPVKRPPLKKPVERQPPAPRPTAIPEVRPAPSAVTGVPAPQPVAPPAAAPVGPEQGANSGPAAPPTMELPSSGAEFLRNPPLVFPPMSKRLGEQGKVVVRVLIGADGTPQQAALKRSSGYDRLDQAAIDYVMKCRYVAGRIAGVPQAMWYDAPVNFVLE
jgi:periplasmic protein TonB